MPINFDHTLVIGVASSALFDTSESEAVYSNGYLDDYRSYQEEHVDDCLPPGPAFAFIKRMLSLNDLGITDAGSPLVEVILFSRNDPETGLPVMKSIQAHGLAITRRIFMGGRAPHLYMEELGVSLFLSGNEPDVRAAMDANIPAGLVMASTGPEDEDEREVRLAFDFDGVLADDSAERIFQEFGLPGFWSHESSNAVTPLPPGPLRPFLGKVRQIQRLEEDLRRADPNYQPRLRISIITARNAPADERTVTSLKHWGVRVDEAHYLGGIDKGKIASVLRPHIYFDDQVDHLKRTVEHAPSVHVPFGALNRAATLPKSEGETAAVEAQVA